MAYDLIVGKQTRRDYSLGRISDTSGVVSQVKSKGPIALILGGTLGVLFFASEGASTRKKNNRGILLSAGVALGGALWRRSQRVTGPDATWIDKI